MGRTKLQEESVDFAVSIVKLCESVSRHYSVVNQLERAATSIGANIHEAHYAHSSADFIMKMEIAEKECNETQYWLELFVRCDLAPREIIVPLYRKCGMIRRMLIASVTTVKSKEEQ